MHCWRAASLAWYAITEVCKGLHLRYDGAAGPRGGPRVGLHGPCPLVLEHKVWPSRPCGLPAHPCILLRVLLNPVTLTATAMHISRKHHA